MLLVTLAFALALAAKASALTPPYEKAALASGRLIGLTSDSCGDGSVTSAISDDRGATWSAGQCVPGGDDIRPDSDGVSISYLARTGMTLVQLDASGAVSASWPTGGQAVFSSGVDGSQAFVWLFGRGIVSVSATGVASCGAMANIGPYNVSSIAAIGPLVVVANGGEGVQSAEFAISNDWCASFTPTSLSLADCQGFSLEPDGSLICGQEHGAIRLDAHNPAAGWAPAVAPPSAFGPMGLARGGLEADVLDSGSFSWAPWTWPKPVRTLGVIPGGTPPPSGAMSQALAYFNTRFRRPMGLADAVWQPQIALSAQRHADYWVANGLGTGLQPHFETTGKPGFEGVTAPDRCAAAGVPDASQCGEDVVPYRTTPLEGVATLMAIPYHGASLLDGLRVGLGLSSAGLAVEFDRGEIINQAAGINVIDYDAPLDTPSAPEHVWPFNGATDIPSRWGGSEYPDPLGGYTGDHSNVGPVLYFSTLNPVQVTLRTASGAAVPLLVPPVLFSTPVPHGLVPSVTSTGGFAVDAVFAGQALDPGATYTLVLSPELSGLPERHYTFTVAGLPHPPSSSGRTLTVLTKIAGCRERLIPSRRTGGRSTAYRFVVSGCKPQTLQVYRRRAWSAVRRKTVVVGRGTHARWRVVYKRHVIASGTLSA